MFQRMCKELENEIINTYSSSITLEEAEKLSGKFLHAQLVVSRELKNADLDSRMRKSGVKAVKAAIYLETVSKSEKKPTEAQIEHIINQTPLVTSEQQLLDEAEVLKADLERYYNIFQQAHVYFRQISRGVQG